VRGVSAALVDARKELAYAVSIAKTPADALHAIDSWHEHSAASTALGDALFVPTVKADMAGQLMVRREAGSTVVHMAAGDGGVPDGKAPFLDLPWDEAIAEFKARGLMSEREFSTMLGDYATRSAEARQLMLTNIQKMMRDRLETALTDGQTLREFAAEVRQGTESLGITEADPSYLQMVFRTNIQSAYGAGRFRQITNPTVMAARPFVQYRTVGDARVRDSHRVLEGMVFRADDPEWHRIAPPNGYNCRCSLVTLDRHEAAGEHVRESVPSDYTPDPDFDGPPTAAM
jgi:SPP1 gp7 family putative phage head morphogenesis protein